MKSSGTFEHCGFEFICSLGFIICDFINQLSICAFLLAHELLVYKTSNGMPRVQPLQLFSSFARNPVAFHLLVAYLELASRIKDIPSDSWDILPKNRLPLATNIALFIFPSFIALMACPKKGTAEGTCPCVGQ
jgi:hypothetical protein